MDKSKKQPEQTARKFADPFRLITNPVPVEIVTFEPSLEAVADETIAMLVEKLGEAEKERGEAEEKLVWHKADTARLNWLAERLDTMDDGVDVCDKIFGDWAFTDIRKAIDAAMRDGK